MPCGYVILWSRIKMDLLLWVSAGSLILNNFIKVNRSYAHINERINSLGLGELRLTICNKRLKMLLNFLSNNDTPPQRGWKVQEGAGAGETRLSGSSGLHEGGPVITPHSWECSRRDRHNLLKANTLWWREKKTHKEWDWRRRNLLFSKIGTTATVLPKSVTAQLHFFQSIS